MDTASKCRRAERSKAAAGQDHEIPVHPRLTAALIVAVVLAIGTHASSAKAATLVPYQFDGLAFYQFGNPPDLIPGAAGASPDTGFVTITNNGLSTFVGNIGFKAFSGFGGNFNSSHTVTLNPGAHVSVSINNESSNYGGFNGPYGNLTIPQSGAQFFMSGSVLLGTDTQSVDLSIFDKDIHSGAPRTNPFGVVLDNYILQGGDPFGRDTGDAYETTQTAGPFQFAQGGPPPDQPITASGTTFGATEGASFSGAIATFTDPDTAATASEYSATIDWGDGSPTDTGVITGSLGSFSVSGTHTYTEEGTKSVTITITDVDNASNGDTASSTANVGDAALGSTCAASSVSATSFSGNVASLTDANPYATSADFTATIDWGDGSSSAGIVNGPTGGPFAVSGNHTYSSTGPKSISVTVNDDGGSTTAVSGCGVLTYAFAPGRGAFVIGNRNSATGTSVAFWSPHWWRLNTLSSGPAPASFKGYAVNPASPSCDTKWSTDPGDSTPPPAGPLPAFMGVLVTSSSSQSASQISGDTVHMVVVQTHPGYAPAVGHAGTGTVVAQIC